MSPNETWLMTRSHLRELRASVVEQLVRVGRKQPSGRTRRWLFAGAIVLFIGVTMAAWYRLPGLQLRWNWLAVSALMAVAAVGVNATEFWLAGRWIDVPLRFTDAVHVSILASAANLAPIPGAVLVRARELYSRGARTDEITRALAALGVGWIGVSLLAAALPLWVVGHTHVAIASAGAGMLLLTLIPYIGRTRWSASRLTTQCLLVEFTSVGVQAVAYLAVFRALGVEIRGFEALGFPLAGALANATGLFPSGIGLRELIAAGIAPLLALPASTGVVASALDRIVSYAVLACAGLASLLHSPCTGTFSPPD